jgi:hypothetical protein
MLTLHHAARRSCRCAPVNFTLGHTTSSCRTRKRVDKITLVLVLVAATFATLAVGVAYFLKASPGSSFGIRLVTSAYAPAIGANFLLVATLWPESYQYNAKGTRLLLQLQSIPLLLALASVTLYPGPRKLHILLVPISFALWAFTFGMSWIAVHGK